MKRPSALVPVITGFGIMLILMSGVTAIGATYIRILSDQLTAIVAERNQKAELATAMRAVHEARYQSLMLASNMADPFLRDEELLRFSHMALEFIQARDQFLALPLDENEFSLWTQIRQEVRAVEAMAEAAITLSQADRIVESRDLIKRHMLPAQVSVMEKWSELVAMQRARNRAAMNEASQAGDQARKLALALSAGAVAVGLIIAAFVIRRSRHLEQALFEEKERAQITLHAIGDAVLRFDTDQRASYLNPSAERLLGISAATAMNQPLDSFLHLHDPEKGENLTSSLARDTLRGNRTPLPDSACLSPLPGTEYEVEGSSTPIHTTTGTVVGGVMVLRDVTAARKLHRKLLWHADHDGLTNLMNRRAFEEKLARILGSKRSGDFPISLLYIDLDHFKPVNDMGGHAAGDALLRQLATLMQSRVRDTDLLARMGGDEFAIVLNACPNAMAEKIAEDIRSSISQCGFEWQGQSFPTGASIGVVHVPPHWATLDECLAAVDAACYQAKQEGRDNIVVHRPQGPGTA